MKIYVLKNCDTCKKALKWLDEQAIAHNAVDVRTDGLEPSDVQLIVETIGWETALNRRSTTWRGLSDEQKSDVTTEKAVALILEQPTLLKRPAFLLDSGPLVGFDKNVQAALQG